MKERDEYWEDSYDDLLARLKVVRNEIENIEIVPACTPNIIKVLILEVLDKYLPEIKEEQKNEGL